MNSPITFKSQELGFVERSVLGETEDSHMEF